MPVFDITLMVTGAILMVIGIVLMLVNRKGAAGGSVNKIEGFGVKLDIANPSLLLIFAGIGMMLVPRFFPDPNVGTATVSATESSGDDGPDVAALADIQPAAGTIERIEPKQQTEPEAENEPGQQSAGPTLVMAQVARPEPPAAKPPVAAVRPNTPVISPPPGPPVVKARPNSPAIPAQPNTSAVVVAKSSPTVSSEPRPVTTVTATRPVPATQVAAVIAPAPVKQPEPASVGVLVRAIPRNEGSRSAEIDAYSRQLTELLEERLQNAATTPLSTRTEVLAAKQLRKLRGENDDYEISKSLCDRMELDALFVAAMEPIYVSDSYGFSYWREPEFVFYDCRLDQRIKETARVEEKGQDRFPFETDLKQRFDRFARPHVSGLQSTP